jgi:hypothetical protein
MQLLRNILLLVEAGAFSVVAFAAGDAAIGGVAALLRRADGAGRGEQSRPEHFPASFLAGYGICAVIGVALGLAHAFYWWSLLLAGVACLVVSRRSVTRLGPALLDAVRQLRRRRDLLWLAGFVVVVVELGAMFIAALAPPTGVDELAYHLPEAQIVVATHHLPLQLGPHYFYGNIPKLFEVLFAEGIALDGNTLPHLLHASIFIAFICTMYVVVRGLYDPRTAILAAALTATLPDATALAQTMYIDTGTTSFECAALLFTLAWMVDRRPRQLAAAALLAGFALSGKYTSAATVVFAGALLGIAFLAAKDRARIAWVVGAAAAVVLAVCGYWYVKNAVRYGNPLYPLYFGHRGVSDEEYTSLLNALQQFGPRTLHAFVRIPERFARPIEVPAFVTFVVAPFAVLIRRRSFVSVGLGVYFVLYVAYWFFIATHQTRFLLPGLFVGSIAAAVVVCSGPTLARIGAAALSLVVLVTMHPRTTLTAANLRSDIGTKLGSRSFSYAIGRQSRDGYLADYFGCQYVVARYLPHHDLRGGVVDDWTQWYGYNLVPYWKNDFAALPANASSIGLTTLSRQLSEQDFRYLYVKESNKAEFALTSDPIIQRWRRDRLPAEQGLLRKAKLIYRVDDCSLYRLPAGGETLAAGRPKTMGAASASAVKTKK